MFFPRKDLASLKLNFPVLSCGFIDDGILAVGGGGGPTKSGLPNELVDTACSAPAEYLIRVAREALLRVFSGRRLSISHSSSYRFETTEDACQAIAAHPSVRIFFEIDGALREYSCRNSPSCAVLMARRILASPARTATVGSSRSMAQGRECGREVDGALFPDIG